MVIAIKVFVREFYRLNASLFFLIIAFAGGFMRGPDHIALGELFISSVSLVLIPIFVWVAYAVMVMEFNAANLHKQGNSFLQCFPLFTKRFQWAFSIVIIACQLVPVILYAGFLSLLAFKNHIHHSFFLIAASLLLISCGMTYWLRQLLKNPTRKERVSLIHFLALHRIRWPYPFVVLRFVLSRRALSLLLYKLFSLSILWSSLYLYKTDNYDLRLLHLGVTISFSLGISFVIEWHAFENVFFSIVKRLPINFLKRSAYAFFIISLFVLPEAMLVLKNFPVEYATSDTLISIMFGASIYFLFYGFLYTRDRKQETIISYASITGLIFFILVLAGIPAGVLMMVNLTAGFLFFRFYYARFELHPDQVQPAKS
jgi:hypothetical protein